MDPLWLSLASIVFVIVSVLALRLHPFLALTFAALLVAILTPTERLFKAALEEESQVVTAVTPTLRVRAGTPRSGVHVVYRQAESRGPFQPVGQVHLKDGQVMADADSPALETGDRLVYEGRQASLESALGASAGARVAFGFGDTCRKIGILIAMASIIGMCLLESGAARRIVDATRQLVGEKNTPAAFAMSGFVVGIPVFFDTVFYLLMPLAKAMRLKTGKNYLLYVMAIVVGATMAHSLVPPTPGPLFVAARMGIHMGTMIVAGCIVGLISVASGFLYVLWANWMWEIPLRETEETTSSAEVDDSPTEAPSIFVSLLPIFIPVVLLSGKTFSEAYMDAVTTAGGSVPDWWRQVQPVMEFLGDKNVALILAAVVALATLARQRIRRGQKDWLSGIQSALSSGGIIILITASGGAFGNALRQCGIADAIQQRFPTAESGLTLLVLAFAITAIVRFAQGSATVAMITSVSIVAPLVQELPLDYHPVYLALAIGCGSKPLQWMNDSGFWIVSRMSGMTEGEALKTLSVTLTIMGVVGFLVTLAGAQWLPLVTP